MFGKLLFRKKKTIRWYNLIQLSSQLFHTLYHVNCLFHLKKTYVHMQKSASIVFEKFLIFQNCRSSDKSIVSICFTPECASFNGNHPIRYCAQCDASRHNKRRGGDHMLHTCLPKAWTMPPDMLIYLVEAIVR